MIERWYRALAWTFASGQPSQSPISARRRSRTLLRLEMVEDRTVASAVVLDVPTAIAPTETQLNSASTPAKKTTDDQTHAGDEGTGTHNPDGPQFSGLPGDAPILMTGDTNVADAAVDTVAPSLHVRASLGEPLAFEGARTDFFVGQPKHEDDSVRNTNTGTSVATDGESLVAAKSDVAQSAVVQATAAEHEASPPPAPSTTNIGRAAGNASPLVRATPTAAESASANHGNVDAFESAPKGTIRPAPGGAAITGNLGSALPAELPDATLLQRFVAHREQAAFTALVQRHGTLVFGVCQRVLGDYHAAQDASQATFVILARKAGMLDRNSPLGGWLYRVAYHLALRSRAVAARQRSVDAEAGDGAAAHDASDIAVDLEQRELQQVVREELQRLPEKYRTPLTLCYFDGQSHADAARSIGVPRGSMGKRIGEGLDRLRERLLHRGFAL